MSLNMLATIVIVLICLFITINISQKMTLDNNLQLAKQGLQQCQQSNGRVIWQKECK